MGMFGTGTHKRRWLERLSEYVDGRLTPQARRQVETHLARCEACRKELEALQSTVALLRRVPQATPPRSFTLQAAPSRVAPRGLLAYQGMLRFATAAAAALFIVVVAGDLALSRVGTGGGLAAERQSAPPATPLDAAGERGAVDATSLASEAATPGSGGQAAPAATLAPEATPSPSPEPPAAFTASSDTPATPSPIPDESFKDTSVETTAKARSIEAAPQPPADLRDRREGRPL
ncbi:MAG: zf-HC2 domain-containing protein, partial [Chloroflexi bacterium]|nr:zf-HC2 domain-containing protein [Chloroflexota bacterium]